MYDLKKYLYNFSFLVLPFILFQLVILKVELKLKKIYILFFYFILFWIYFSEHKCIIVIDLINDNHTGVHDI